MTKACRQLSCCLGAERAALHVFLAFEIHVGLLTVVQSSSTRCYLLGPSRSCGNFLGIELSVPLPLQASLGMNSLMTAYAESVQSRSLEITSTLLYVHVIAEGLLITFQKGKSKS